MFSTVMVMVRVNADICVRNRPKINSNLQDYLRRVFRFFCFADVYPYALLCFFSDGTTSRRIRIYTAHRRD